MSWNGHRWSRYRSAMAGLATALLDFRQSVQSCMPGDVPLDVLLSDRDQPPCYKFDSEFQLDASREATDDLLDYLQKLAGMAADQPFGNPPHPPVEFGSRAPI